MKSPQRIFSLKADLLFPAKYIAKVLVAEQKELVRREKEAEYHQWSMNEWRRRNEERRYQQQQQQQQQQEEEEAPWYKTYFRGDEIPVPSIYEIDTAAAAVGNNMGTTALDYNKLWKDAKASFSERENFDPNYTPLPQQQHDYNDKYYPSAPPLSKDQIDVYGGMSQNLKDSCVPLIPRRKPPQHQQRPTRKGFGRGWIKRKRRLHNQKKSTLSTYPLVEIPNHVYDDMPDLESGIPFPGSSSSSSSSSSNTNSNKYANSGLRRRKRNRGSLTETTTNVKKI